MAVLQPSGLQRIDAAIDQISHELGKSIVLLEKWKIRKGHHLSAAHKAAISAALKGKGKGKSAAGGGAAATGGADDVIKGQAGETVQLPDGSTATISAMKGKAWAKLEGAPKSWYKTSELKSVPKPTQHPDPAGTAGATKAAAGSKAFTGTGSVTQLKVNHPVGSTIKTPDGDFVVSKHATNYVQVAGGPKKWYKTSELEAHAKSLGGAPAHADSTGTHGSAAPSASSAAAHAAPAASKAKSVTTASMNALLADSGVPQSQKYNQAVAGNVGKITSHYVKADSTGFKVSTVNGVTQIDVPGANSQKNLAKIKAHLDVNGVDYTHNTGGAPITIKGKTFEPGSGPKPGASPHSIGDTIEVGGQKWTVSAIHNDGSISAHPEGKPFASQTATWPKKMSDSFLPLNKADGPKAEPKSNWPEHPDSLKTVQALGGSTGAKLVEGPDGTKYVHKQGNSPEHLKAEFAADRVYEAAGVAVPKGHLYDADGKPTKLTEYLADAKPLSHVTGKEYDSAVAQLKKNFVLDAVLANRDVAGMGLDNIMVTKDGQAVRIDNGSSFDFRAQGKKKPFTNNVEELDTMLDPAKNANTAKLFGGITAKEMHDQALSLKANEKAILDATPQQYKATMQARIDDAVARTKAKLDAETASAPSTAALSTKHPTTGEHVGVGDTLDYGGGVKMKVTKVHPDGNVDLEVTHTDGGFKVGEQYSNKKVPSYSKVEPAATPAAPSATKAVEHGAVIKHPDYGTITVTSKNPSGSISGYTSDGHTAFIPSGKAGDVSVIHAAGEAKYFAATAPGKKALSVMHPVGSTIKTPDGDFVVTGHTTGNIQVAGAPKKWYKAEQLAAHASTPAAIAVTGQGAKPSNISSSAPSTPTSSGATAKIAGGTHEVKVGDHVTSPNGNTYKIDAINPNGSLSLIKTASVTGAPVGSPYTANGAVLGQYKPANAAAYATSTGPANAAAAHAITPPAKGVISPSSGSEKYTAGAPPAVGQAVYVQGHNKTGYVESIANGHAQVKLDNGSSVSVPLAADVGSSTLKPYAPGKVGISSPSYGPSTFGGTSATAQAALASSLSPNLHENASWKSKYTTWAGSLSSPQKAAVVSYTGSEYANMNSTLRQQTLGSASPSLKSKIKRMDEALAKDTTDRDITVYRGFNWSNFDPARIKEGTVITDHGYGSTSVSHGSAFNANIRYEINVPKGSSGAYVAGISHYASEKEFILPRGYQVKVKEMVEVPGKYGGKQYVLKVDLVGFADASTGAKVGTFETPQASSPAA